MKYITLTPEQESKWLEYLQSERKEFLLRLLKKLVNEKSAKLFLSNELLREIVIKRKPIDNSLNDTDEYVEMQDEFVDIDNDNDNLLNSICNYLDFSNIEYHDLKLSKDTITYLKRYNIPIIPNKLYKKSLQGYTFEECVFDGSFDDCDISLATIKNCRDINGNLVKINPQNIKDKNLTSCLLENIAFDGSFEGCSIMNLKIRNCKNVKINPQTVKDKYFWCSNLDGVEFTDSFDGCDIREMILKNCKNAKINPQNVDDKSLYSCELEDVEFTGGFDDCRIAKMSIKNCKNAKINPQKVVNRDLSNCVFNGVEFTGPIDFCELEDVRLENVSNLHVNAENLRLPQNCFFTKNKFNLKNITIYAKNSSAFIELWDIATCLCCDKTTKIVCNLKNIEGLKEYDAYKNCTFLTLHSEMDDSLDEVFSINNASNANSIDLETEETIVKQKKKSIFDRFKRK